MTTLQEKIEKYWQGAKEAVENRDLELLFKYTKGLKAIEKRLDNYPHTTKLPTIE